MYKILSMILLIILIPGIMSINAISPHPGYHDDYGFPKPLAYESCGNSCFHDLSNSYTILYKIYGLELDNKTKFIESQDRQISHLQDEVNVWQSKYNHLLLSQGAPDQIENLTNRIVSLENQTAVNEGYVFQLRSVVKSLQADVADIYLKINSVR